MNKPKVLTGLNQKVCGRLLLSYMGHTDMRPPAYRQDLPYSL